MGSIADGDGIFPTRRRVRQTWSETIGEAARTIPVMRACDVLVVGGGPAGSAAATAAARAGADTVLLERYNHLGGLATGGLVIWIDRMTDWSGDLVIRGFAEQLLGRLPASAIKGPPADAFGSIDADLVEHWRRRSSAHHGIVTWAPTIHPEHLKTESQRMVLESGAELLFHGWAAEPVLDHAGAVAGVFFESKEGRRAIRAKVVVDCTGDGDIFHRAGARSDADIEEQSIHHCMNTSWLFGGVDMGAWLAFRYGQPAAFGAFMEAGRHISARGFEKPVVSWDDNIALFMGPRLAGLSGVDVLDLSEAEIASREAMMAHLSFYRANAPGFAKAELLQAGSQLGVRHSRRLVGRARVRRADWASGGATDEQIGVSPSLAPQWPSLAIPYGCLVPEKLDGLLAAGRHVSCDPTSHSILREIPQCWLTGQAAGVAAAIAVATKAQPRSIDIAELQRGLIAQGVFLPQEYRVGPSGTERCRDAL